VSLRRQPPVLSRVSNRALVSGFSAAIGLERRAVEDVEELLRDRYNALDALATNSGTSALILALRKILPAGGTVAYPGYSCIDLTTAALGAGLRVRLYDLDPETLSPDLDSVRAVLSRGVDAIVVAHLYGYPADVSSVVSIAAEYGIPVIEDAAQGAGGTLRGARLGSLADVSILSFSRGKGTTGGSGGAVLVRSDALAEWTRTMRATLAAPPETGLEVVSLLAQRVFSHPSVYGVPASIPALKLGEMVYHPPRAPLAMSSTSAAILRWNLRDEEQETEARRMRARVLLERIAESGIARPVHTVRDGESGYLRLAALDSSGATRSRTDLGVVRGYPMTLDQHHQLFPVLLTGERAGCGSLYLRDSLVTIPTHWHFAAADLRSLVALEDRLSETRRVVAFS